MAQQTILVVDDEPAIRESVKDILQDEGYLVYLAENGSAARKLYSTRRPDLVLLDIWMPDVDGITLLKEWSALRDRKTPIIMISGHGTVETAVEATRHGAYDFIEKPLSLGRLIATVRNALRAPHDVLAPSAKKIYLPLYPIGKSTAILNVKQQIEQLSKSRVPLCLVGEVGTGRSFWVKFLHAIDEHRESHFVAVNAQLFNNSEIDRLLHGSNAQLDSPTGLLAKARGGILYIEDAQQLSANALDALAACFSFGSVVTPGQKQLAAAEVRLVISVDSFFWRGLKERSQLHPFFKYALVPVQVPSLRERSEDIPELLNHFVNRLVESELLPFKTFTVAAQNRLRYYSWPGNLPELKNVVRQLLLTIRKEEIDAPDIERFLGRTSAQFPDMEQLFAYPLRDAREIFEKAYIQHYLDAYQGNVGQIADICGLERTHLYRKIKSLGIDIKREKLQK